MIPSEQLLAGGPRARPASPRPLPPLAGFTPSWPHIRALPLALADSCD